MKPHFPTHSLQTMRQPMFNYVQTQFPRWRHIVESGGTQCWQPFHWLTKHMVRLANPVDVLMNGDKNYS